MEVACCRGHGANSAIQQADYEIYIVLDEDIVKSTCLGCLPDLFLGFFVLLITERIP